MHQATPDPAFAGRRGCFMETMLQAVQISEGEGVVPRATQVERSRRQRQ